jgi:phosphoserine aminotransferase
MIDEIFSPKNFTKILAFFAQATASFYKKLIITLVFEKNAISFAENWQKSQKIVIITSTPDNFGKIVTYWYIHSKITYVGVCAFHTLLHFLSGVF